MNTNIRIIGPALFCALFIISQAPDAVAQPETSEQPGDEGRAALSKVDFLVGRWEGEGWSLTSSGERSKFLIKESYIYRGAKDLLDMEGRFRDVLSDGSVAPKEDYALGILFYDAASKEYRMWHYSSNGNVFSVKMDMDIKARTAQYTRRRDNGELSKFSLTVGNDGVWVSKIEILTQDKSWLKVMEFRMKRVDGL